jgi:hypothetical protein
VLPIESRYSAAGIGVLRDGHDRYDGAGRGDRRRSHADSNESRAGTVVAEANLAVNTHRRTLHVGVIPAVVAVGVTSHMQDAHRTQSTTESTALSADHTLPMLARCSFVVRQMRDRLTVSKGRMHACE